MSEFTKFAQSINDNFQLLAINKLYTTSISGDELYELYLKAFPPGTNNIFRQRLEYDCQCCKRFIRNIGNVVAIQNNKLVSIWRTSNLEYPFNEVALALADIVEKQEITNIFLHSEPFTGSKPNKDTHNSEITWNHFYSTIPKKYQELATNIDSTLGTVKTTAEMLKRALTEITPESIETVIDLINQNSIYRGSEFLESITTFKTLQDNYFTDLNKQTFIWQNINNKSARIRNTVIGTLLTDLSEGKDLNISVSSYESKVAPQNYQRPSTLITVKMIQQAQKKLTTLGLLDSSERRFAVAEDLNINDVLFADRSIKDVMKNSPFESLLQEHSGRAKNLNKIDKISIEDFISKIIPTAESIEILFENKYQNKLMSLIAPKIKSAPSMFQWENNFCHVYNGNVADSIKERVKIAGGRTENVVMRFSAAWDGATDLDIHCIEPTGHIYYKMVRRTFPSSGILDIDANGVDGPRLKPVENIIYTNKSKMPYGTYQFYIHNFNQRDNELNPIRAELELNGKTYTFSYPQGLRQAQNIVFVEVMLDENGVFSIISSLPHQETETLIWNVKTNHFHKAKMLMYSPNYWENSSMKGNKHIFFILENCLNPEAPRGFFNEFLKPELKEYRKVFEVLGNKMKVESSTNQLSGLGFSFTQQDEIIVKVIGSFNRTIKVQF